MLSFSKNYKQKTENYFANSYAVINKGESQGEEEGMSYTLYYFVLASQF